MQNTIEQTVNRGDFTDLCVLLVEDDEIMRMSLADRLRIESIPVRDVGDTASAKKELKKGDIDLVVTDVLLPDGTGIELFSDISHNFPGIPVILMTAYGDISDAVAVVKDGALDYLTKPFDINDFMKCVTHQLSSISDIHLMANSDGDDINYFKPGSGCLGKSDAMRRIERLVARLRDSDSSILLTGESGVGKEVVANLIHQNSLRSQGPMVSVNCAALPSTLIESELFGHEKGAFTGATQLRKGRFEQAQGGTIFLDEIAEVSPDIQVKLLRVLQEREFERVGGSTPIPLDVRVIAATQAKLDKSIETNEFRPDLYWRLNVIHIDIPPLRQRREDIVYLARQFVNQLVKSKHGSIKGLSKEAELHLQSMTYPGNVRELKNVIERAVTLCDGPWIRKSDLSISEQNESFNDTTTLKESIEAAERESIIRALAENSGRIAQTANSLGISRKNLWQKMKRYGIDK
ncbi:MAG: sigma-54-dependent Fis family transcriptional regulator [gamma proteobacterium symbiont of Ctena orbiculata]|nr:MAG: sigma-54-dependent Fis family transcriptional regulator [gamma proteobacterium symbiont of Ctena orbiculata]